MVGEICCPNVILGGFYFYTIYYENAATENDGKCSFVTHLLAHNTALQQGIKCERIKSYRWNV